MTSELTDFIKLKIMQLDASDLIKEGKRGGKGASPFDDDDGYPTLEVNKPTPIAKVSTQSLKLG